MSISNRDFPSENAIFPGILKTPRAVLFSINISAEKFLCSPNSFAIAFSILGVGGPPIPPPGPPGRALRRLVWASQTNDIVTSVIKNSVVDRILIPCFSQHYHAPAQNAMPFASVARAPFQQTAAARKALLRREKERFEAGIV